MFLRLVTKTLDFMTDRDPLCRANSFVCSSMLFIFDNQLMEK